MQIFTGIYPALVTPSNDDHSVNTDTLNALVDYLLDKNVDGFYVGGTTGEGIFMSVASRKLLTETVLSRIDGRVTVIVHAGATSVEDAIDLATHARDHGAAAVSSIIPPVYNNINSVAHYYRVMAAAVSDIPFLPYILNPELNALALIQEVQDIPNLGGTKYTGSNMYEFSRIRDLGGGAWTMFSGMDEQCVYAAMMGATGAIGSTLNMMPGAYRAIRENVVSGNLAEAQALQERANEIVTTMLEFGFQAALKDILTMLIGQPVGAPRLPHLPLSDEKRKELHAALSRTDFNALAAM